MSVNRAILVGRLGADPEMRTTGSGTSVCNFSLATSEQWADRDGNKHERTEWHKITAWGRLGEICHEHLRKGAQVYVEGKIQTSKWTDRDGNDRYTTGITAAEVKFLSSTQAGRAETGAAAGQESSGGNGGGEPGGVGAPPWDR